VNVSGVRPSRLSGDNVKLSEKLAENLIRVGLGAEIIELREHFGQRAFRVDDGVFGEELALLLEATPAFDELFAVEV